MAKSKSAATASSRGVLLRRGCERRVTCVGARECWPMCRGGKEGAVRGRELYCERVEVPRRGNSIQPMRKKWDVSFLEDKSPLRRLSLNRSQCRTALPSTTPCRRIKSSTRDFTPRNHTEMITGLGSGVDRHQKARQRTTLLYVPRGVPSASLSLLFWAGF